MYAEYHFLYGLKIVWQKGKSSYTSTPDPWFDKFRIIVRQYCIYNVVKYIENVIEHFFMTVFNYSIIELKVVTVVINNPCFLLFRNFDISYRKCMSVSFLFNNLVGLTFLFLYENLILIFKLLRKYLYHCQFLITLMI